MDLEFYDYDNFSNLRYQELKNNWIQSEGSMDSNEDYFHWPNPLKLPANQKNYANEDIVKFDMNDRKRKYFSNNEGNVKKIHIEGIKDPLAINSNLIQKQNLEKDVQNGK